MTLRPYYSPPYRSSVGEAIPEQLCPNSAENYREFLSWFKARYLPCIPVDILDTSDEEEWELGPEGEAEEIDLCDYLTVVIEDYPSAWAYEASVTLAGGRTERFGAGSRKTLAYSVSAWFAGADPDSRLAEVAGLTGWDDDWFLQASEDEDARRYVARLGGEDISVHDNEQDALDASEQRAHEDRSGAFPWVWNWCWYPPDNIRTEDLEACGFSVATFRGHRLCGINGAGYNFPDAHFLPLAWRVAERWNLVVERDDGSRVLPITQPPETALT